MRNFKVENLVAIIMIMLFGGCVVSHVMANGLYEMLPTEVAMYGAVIVAVRAIIKDIRKNPQNWK